jgi:predicted transcriptional regulator
LKKEPGESDRDLGRLEKGPVQSEKVLVASTHDLFESVHGLPQSDEDPGEKQELLVRLATDLFRSGDDLRRVQKVVDRLAEARSRQEKGMVETAVVLFESKEDRDESDEEGRRPKKAGAKTAKALFGHSRENSTRNENRIVQDADLIHAKKAERRTSAVASICECDGARPRGAGGAGDQRTSLSVRSRL